MKSIRKSMNGVAELGRAKALGKRPDVNINTAHGARIRQKRAVNTKKL